MVCINTLNQYHNIQFTHFVDIPGSESFIATARDQVTRCIKVFLVVNHHGKIYSRQGLSGTWLELRIGEAGYIRELVNQGLRNKSVPYYSTIGSRN